MSVAAKLTGKLQQAGIPILGVSIGRDDDRDSWKVHYAADVTLEQLTQGAAIVSLFDPEAVEPVDLDKEADSSFASKPLQALVVWSAMKFGISVAQAKQELKAIYKGLP